MKIKFEVSMKLIDGTTNYNEIIQRLSQDISSLVVGNYCFDAQIIGFKVVEEKKEVSE
jgi:hypothetical protein